MPHRHCFIDLPLCLLLAFGGAFAADRLIAADRPNIVLIFADDKYEDATAITRNHRRTLKKYEKQCLFRTTANSVNFSSIAGD
jgi:hypothetical protein